VIVRTWAAQPVPDEHFRDLSAYTDESPAWSVPGSPKAPPSWRTPCAVPMHFEVHPRMRELLGPGRTIHLHATDTPPQAAAEWLVDLTGDAIVWRCVAARLLAGRG
jgi:hypothetical protein